MSRQIRKKSGTGIYHVMLRGINRQDIFEDDEDYLQMTSILRGQSERYDEKGHLIAPYCTFYAYCLMSNHLHLLIQERDETVSDIVKRIGVTYAHYFNKKYERSGHLFQDRFRSEPVDNIEYFVTSPIEADGQIMDIDTDGNKSMSDSDVKAFHQKSQGIANPLMVQSLEKTRRNEVLRYALYFGAGV